jgi:hypothetical protein
MKKKIVAKPVVRSHHAKPIPPLEVLENERKRLSVLKLGMGGDTDTIDLQIAEIERKIHESQG